MAYVLRILCFLLMVAMLGLGIAALFSVLQMVIASPFASLGALQILEGLVGLLLAVSGLAFTVSFVHLLVPGPSRPSRPLH
jgi:hypothetical protein